MSDENTISSLEQPVLVSTPPPLSAPALPARPLNPKLQEILNQQNGFMQTIMADLAKRQQKEEDDQLTHSDREFINARKRQCRALERIADAMQQYVDHLCGPQMDAELTDELKELEE
jgi:hypothetical protein